jgi:hypothetical protein
MAVVAGSEMRLNARTTSTVRKVLAHLDACMYCGSKDPDRGEEHIIPASLNGTLVLSKAACRACRDKTSRFELDLARGTFLVARTRLAMRTRRKAERPEYFPVVLIASDGSRTTELVPVREVPLSICFPLLPPPTELADVPRDDRERAAQLEIRLSREEEINRFLLSRSAVRAEMETKLRPHSMMRLVAKVAYGFVVANKTIRLRENFVLPTILGDEPHPERWVGNLEHDYGRQGRDLHQVSIIQHSEHVIGFVRLFALLGAPEYTVIVGKV